MKTVVYVFFPLNFNYWEWFRDRYPDCEGWRVLYPSFHASMFGDTPFNFPGAVYFQELLYDI